jgi:hypothetical protein
MGNKATEKRKAARRRKRNKELVERQMNMAQSHSGGRPVVLDAPPLPRFGTARRPIVPRDRAGISNIGADVGSAPARAENSSGYRIGAPDREPGLRHRLGDALEEAGLDPETGAEVDRALGLVRDPGESPRVVRRPGRRLAR